MPKQIKSTALERLARQLFSQEDAQECFVAAVISGNTSASALIAFDNAPEPLPFKLLPRADWQPSWVFRVADDEHPGTSPLHAQGAYYCLDLSSVFGASITLDLPEPPQTVLDLCAAPGGKSAFLWRAFHPRELLCNEAIGKRSGQLRSNLQRCRISAKVSTLDPAQLALLNPGGFSLVVVDAPCSGQSLVARGKAAPGCFHPAIINMNANRQRRIIANAQALVAPEGYLAYMTCTYSHEENEKNVEWFLKRFPKFTPCASTRLSRFRSELSTLECYRLFPQCGFGAGGFTALLRKIK